MRRWKRAVLLLPGALLAVLAGVHDATMPAGSAGGPRWEWRELLRWTGMVEDQSERPRLSGAAAMYERRWLQRSAGRGIIPQGWLMDAVEHAKRMPGSSMEKDAGIWAWWWYGPGNIGGRIRSILLHPTNSNRMWVGGVSGGIWTTTDGGASWSAVDDFLPSLSITSIVLDPTSPSVMYASTGEAIFAGGAASTSAPPGAGIFKSTDGGSTWSQLLSTTAWSYVTDLAHHPSSANTLYAATEGPRGVFRSTDGGQSWTQVLASPTTPVDLEIHPTLPGRVYVGCSARGGTTGDVYRATDGITFGPLAVPGTNNLPTDAGRCEVELAAGNTVYVQVDKNGGEVWRSTSSGDLGTWNLQGTPGSFGGIGWYANALWVDPTNSSRLLSGGVELYRSTDSGVNWTLISNTGLYWDGLSGHADYHEIASHIGYNGTSNRSVFVGNDGGIQRITDLLTVTSNSGWTNLANNLGITQFYHGAAAPDASVIVGGTQDNSAPTWSGGGSGSWYVDDLNFVTDAGFTAVDPNNPSILYSESQYLNMKKSTDTGVTWFPIVNGLTDADEAQFVSPFVLDPNNSNVLIAGGLSLWKTTNGGTLWTSLRPALGAGISCTALGIKQGNSNEIWAGYSDGTVSRSTNGGTSWSNLDGGSPGLPNRWVMDLAVSPFYANEAVVVFSGIFNNNVWATFDGGSTWSQRTGAPPDDLPSVQVNTVAYHPVNPNWLYIGTDIGIFASEDFGGRWNITPSWGIQDAPAYVEVDELFWAGDRMLAATWGRGMYLCRPLDVVYVDWSNAGAEDGTAADPWSAVGEGESWRGPGAALSIRNGTYTEGAQVIGKRGLVVSSGGAAVVR